MTDLADASQYSSETLQLARELLAGIERNRREQPERLAKARAEADEARGWALIEEPWETLVMAPPAVNEHGQRTGNAIALPSITAKELMGARLAFDMLDAGDTDQLDDVKTRYFAELGGDTGVLFLVCMAALDTIASIVVPQLLNDLEHHGSNYDARVMLAEARTKAWADRVHEIRDRINNGDLPDPEPQ